VRRTAERIAAREGVSARELLARLAVQPDAALMDELVAIATVPHTSFYRHKEQFDYLRRRFLPRLRESGRHLNAWSAGCASGEEAYTLAMVAEDAGVSARILATDISRARIEEAREGNYSPRAARKIPGALERAWRAPASLKRSVRFEVASLTGPDPSRGYGPFDLIFCRNVLIYFDVEEGLSIVRTLLSRLKPEGALVVAPTEAVVRASWRRPDPDAPVGWFVPDRGTRRPTPPATRSGAAAPLVRRALPDPTPPSAKRPSHPETPGLEEAARLLSAGETKAAERMLSAFLDEDPEHAEGWFLLGEALFSRGELTQAGAAFRRASRATRFGDVDPQTLRDAALRRAAACG
jgi:chemotaxis protein methyltransferase CheR